MINKQSREWRRPMQRMDVWFCAKQEPLQEAQSQADDAAKIQTGAPNARTDIPAPLDEIYHGSRHLGQVVSVVDAKRVIANLPVSDFPGP